MKFLQTIIQFFKYLFGPNVEKIATDALVALLKRELGPIAIDLIAVAQGDRGRDKLFDVAEQLVPYILGYFRGNTIRDIDDDLETLAGRAFDLAVQLAQSVFTQSLVGGAASRLIKEA